jgi:hypothetical protein
MSNVDDLLDPLRFNNLGAFELPDVRSIGGGVFAEKGTLEHLKTLDLVVKAYTSIHAPTYGHQIPTTPYAKLATIDSATTTKLLEPAKNEVYRVDTVNVMSGEVDTTFHIAMTYNSDIGAVNLALTLADTIKELNTETPMLSINQPIIVTYPQVLTCITASSGDIDMSVIIGYTKLQQ